jgi:hypothetical protein
MRLKENSNWRIQDTAKALRCSIGSVSENLLIASWLRTHENQLLKFDYAREALDFIREKKKKMAMGEVD